MTPLTPRSQTILEFTTDLIFSVHCLYKHSILLHLQDINAEWGLETEDDQDILKQKRSFTIKIMSDYVINILEEMDNITAHFTEYKDLIGKETKQDVQFNLCDLQKKEK